MDAKETFKMTQLDLQSVVYKDGQHYVAQCLNVDVSSFGSNETSALANLKEALELYFEDITKPNITQVEAPHVQTLILQSA
jgi:predicted RNase H-like HicB family nuclease